jgi:hypothetical protein
MNTIQWLHRYVFKGIGIAFLIGVITGLYLMINEFRELAHKAAASQHQIQGVKR